MCLVTSVSLSVCLIEDSSSTVWFDGSEVRITVFRSKQFGGQLLSISIDAELKFFKGKNQLNWLGRHEL